jgi:phosphate transport system substrate-binding protein
MKHINLLSAVAGCGCMCLLLFVPAAWALEGAGASFPFPLYATWFMQFSRDPDIRDSWNSTGARVSYQATGSEAGIEDLTIGAVDFAASDTAMTDDQIKQIEQGVLVLPMTAGEVVLAYNLTGVDALKLPRAVYPKIFSGEITNWSDPAIVAANPDVALPDQAITVVVRADAARSSEVLSGHLSAIDPSLEGAVGHSRSPQWPEQDPFVHEPRNDGVAAKLAQTPGAIGYLEYGYAELAGWTQIARLENKAGNFVAPGPASGAEAIAAAEFPEGTLPGGAADLRARMRDPSGESAYPIISLSWMLFYATGYADDELTAIRDLINYCTSAEAQAQADGLGYVPLPDSLLGRVRQAAETIK